MDGKRTDVGYKRPPAEYRFKKGQKPPPRKPRPAPETNLVDMFWRVLQEPRRVRIDGKHVWMPTSELLVLQAYREAEKGSSTLNRLVNDQLLAGYTPEDEDAYEYVIIKDDGTEGDVYHWPPKQK